MKKIFFIAVLFLFNTGCLDKSNPVSSTLTEEEINLGDEFLLSFNHEIQIKGEALVIKFSSVPEDTRCPKDVICVWEGNAHIVLLLNKSDNIDLNSTLPSNEKTYKNSYKITLLEVQPIPISTQQIELDTYKVKLKVEKLIP